MLVNELQAIYVTWLREMKRFVRTKSRIISMIIQPIFFLFVLGGGLRNVTMPGMTAGNYLDFLAPGVIAMAILFSSMFTGSSVLWDKQFGFLQEILVAPISRFSFVIGRTLGGATTAMIQGSIILLMALALGVKVAGILGLLETIVFMLLLSFTAVGFGLAIASRMQDFQGFQIIINLIITPLFFVSSALFPIAQNPDFPDYAIKASYVNPLFYMVDGLRGSLTGINSALNPLIDLLIVLLICIIVLGIGSYLFSKSEV